MNVKHLSVAALLVAALGVFGSGCSIGPSSSVTSKTLAPAQPPSAAPTIPPEAAKIPRPY